MSAAESAGQEADDGKPLPVPMTPARPLWVAMANAALAVFVLPAPPYVRITTSLLILAALLQFLIPAVRILLAARRRP